MEELTIRKKGIPSASQHSSGLAHTLVGCLIFVAILVAIPFLLVGLLIGIIRDKLIPAEPATLDGLHPIIMHDVPNEYFILRYQ